MRAWMLCAVAAAQLSAAPLAAQESGKIDLQIVNYDGLKQAILANRGKVILVDFWFQFCKPCKDRMPHLVELHHKHTKDGLVILTVTADPPESRKQVLAILNSVNASFTNLLLDEPAELFEQKLRVASFPTYYIFDRRGKWVHVTGNIDYNAVDRLLLQLLQEN